ncbi:MAG: adenylosuccinate synthase [Brevinema sp.]
MPANIIVGTQWGDEGKGKVIDSLGERIDCIVRFGGGNNAGHTVNVNGEKFILHLLPSGVLHKDSRCLLGAGVVFDPKVFLEEIEGLKKRNIPTDHVHISERAHLIMPYHVLLDQLWEQYKGDNKIGTTKRGIGPCYSDKFERIGLRVGDLYDKALFKEKLARVLEIKNKILINIFNHEPLSLDKIYEDYMRMAEEILPRVMNVSTYLHVALKLNKNVLLEGAQGAMLDIDYGHYPYVTSSSPTAAGACVGTGIAPKYIDRVIGVCKAYATRVGEGPFVSELLDAQGHWLREKGHEYGSTTGRPRRCGWLDTVVVKHAAQINGLTEICLTKLDVLTGLDKIKICTAYEINNQEITYVPSDVNYNYNAQAVYETLDGWDEDITQCKSFDELPENAKLFIKRIEELVECPISIVSNGAERSQLIIRDDVIQTLGK